MTFRAIIITLLIFGSLIFLHEFGHYLFARLFHVGVNEFSIGMGPKILSKVSKKSNIRYSLRLFPIGGFVSMTGEDEESDAPDAFDKKPVWQRLLVVFAGPLTNVVVGFLAMVIMVIGTGYQSSTRLAAFSENAGSNGSGYLQLEDTVKKVNGKRVYTGTGLLYALMFEYGEPQTVTVERDGETVTIENAICVDMVVERDGKTVEVKNVPFATEVEEGVMTCVPDFFVYGTPLTFFGVIQQSFHDSFATVRLIWQTLGGLLRGQYGITALSGPVGVTEAVSSVDTHDWLNVIYLFILITMNLGVCNLIPFPALDGGRLLVLLIELVTRRPVNRKVEGIINYVGLMILFALMIFITGKDIIHLFK